MILLRHRRELIVLVILGGCAAAAALPEERLRIAVGLALFVFAMTFIPSVGINAVKNHEGGWWSAFFWSSLTPAWMRAAAIVVELAILLGLIYAWVRIF